MGKTALLAIAAFTVVSAYYASSSFQGMRQSDTRVANHQYEVLARNAALAGYQQARQDLAEHNTFTGITANRTGTYQDATYTTRVTVNGTKTRATIRSTGKAMSGGQPVTFNVYAEIERELVSKIADEPPVFMQYALLAEQDLDLSGNIIGEVYVQGDERNTLNANMHTNGNLDIGGNSVSVQGFGSYVGYGSANPSRALAGSFSPNYNPTASPTVQRTARVDIPAFDAALYTSRTTVDRVTSGNQALSGSLTLGGTRDNPYVWRVTGNLTCTGNTKLTGYVLFIVDGKVTFNGNLEAGASGYDGPEESNIAVYAGNGVELGGNTRVTGQIYTGGNVMFMHGTPRVYGSVTTRGRADLRGTPKIYYRPASPALTTIWQEPEVRLKLIGYSER